MAFSRRNSSILPRSPKDGSNVFVFFEARQAKSSGASSRAASGSVREVSSSLGNMLGAVPTFRLEGFSDKASSRSRETCALAAASRERHLRTFFSSFLIACYSPMLVVVISRANVSPSVQTLKGIYPVQVGLVRLGLEARDKIRVKSFVTAHGGTLFLNLVWVGGCSLPTERGWPRLGAWQFPH